MNYVKKISIITLTYNNQHVIGTAIQSVASQIIDKKYEIEHIIIDDASQKFDKKIIEQHLAAAKLDSKIVINEKNLGIVANLNKAISISTGDIIIVLAADDEFYDKDVVNDIAKAFERTNAKIITGLRIPIIGNKEQDSLPEKKLRHLFKNRERLLNRLIYTGNIIAGAATYYHKSIFKILGPFDEKYRLLEDWPYYIKALSEGFDIELLERPTIRYGTSGVSSKSAANESISNDTKTLFKDIYKNKKHTLLNSRKIKYRRIFEKKERLKNLPLYPEQALWRTIDKILKKFIKSA